jgi:hypothetical protein
VIPPVAVGQDVQGSHGIHLARRGQRGQSRVSDEVAIRHCGQGHRLVGCRSGARKVPVTATCCECETFCPHLTADWARIHSRRAPVPRSTVRTSTPGRCREPAAHRLRFPRSIPVCDAAASTASAASITAAGPGSHLVPMHRPNTSQIADPDPRLKHGRSNRAADPSRLICASRLTNGYLNSRHSYSAIGALVGEYGNRPTVTFGDSRHGGLPGTDGLPAA